MNIFGGQSAQPRNNFDQIKQREKVRFDSIASTDLLKESVEVFEKLDLGQAIDMKDILETQIIDTEVKGRSFYRQTRNRPVILKQIKDKKQNGNLLILIRV